MNLKTRRYIIEGNPIPSPRLRMGNTRMWETQRQNKWEYSGKLRLQHNDEPLFKGPLILDINFYFSPPKTSPKREEQLKGSYHTIKPDLNNLVKFIEDTALGVLFSDDYTIAEIKSKKLYDKTPRTEIIITE